MTDPRSHLNLANSHIADTHIYLHNPLHIQITHIGVSYKQCDFLEIVSKWNRKFDILLSIQNMYYYLQFRSFLILNLQFPSIPQKFFGFELKNKSNFLSHYETI